MKTLIHWWCQRCGEDNYFAHKVKIGCFKMAVTCDACSTTHEIRFNIIPEIRSIRTSYNREMVE